MKRKRKHIKSRRFTAFLLCLSMIMSMISGVGALTVHASDNDSIKKDGGIILDSDASGDSEGSSQTEAVDADTEEKTVTEADSGTAASPNAEKTDEETEKPGEEDSVSGNVVASGDDTETKGEKSVKEHDYASELEGDISVAADLSKGTKLPDGAALEVERLESGEKGYDDALFAVLEGLALPEGSEPEASLYDIRFEANGEEVEPSGSVRVTVESGKLFGDASKCAVVHVKDDGKAEKLDAEWSDHGTVTFDVDSFSVFGFVKTDSDDGIQTVEADAPSSPVRWGNAKSSDETIVEGEMGQDGIYIWDLTKTDPDQNLDYTKHRYLSVPVEIQVSSDTKVTITLDQYINNVDDVTEENRDNIRSGFDKVVVDTNAVANMCDISTSGNKVTLTFKPDAGKFTTFQIPYRFDCWGVVSGQKFSVDYTYEVEDKPDQKKSGKLEGIIKTGCGFEIVNDCNDDDPNTYYYKNGRGKGFSLSEFGGADYITSYIQNWSSVYKKYFDFDENRYNSDKATDNTDKGQNGYIYDVVPFLVRPSGQQPYDISGELTLENGEILGGVYMMKSAAGSKAPWRKLTKEAESDTNHYKFSFKNDQTFDGPKLNQDDTLLKEVVTGNLTDDVDNEYYTLYFLVRYEISKLEAEDVKDATYGNPDHEKAYKPKAKLSLTHTGVDQATDHQDATKNEKDQITYHGPLTESQIYDAYYTDYTKEQKDALSNLAHGANATLDFEADFFCYNEAREDFDKENKYRLESVIDLLYLTDKRPYYDENNENRLNKDDYRLNNFSLSLVDAPGNWSQRWYYEEKSGDKNEVWKEQRPNVGWPEETWTKWAEPQNPEAQAEKAKYSKVFVYGSESLTEETEDSWELIQDYTVDQIWAKDQGRGIVIEPKEIDKKKNYVRLKVVYDSRWTTALRIGYEVELLPGILNNHEILKTVDEYGLTAWFNYFGYKKDKSKEGNDKKDWSADTDNMNCNAYVHTDASGDDQGTVEQARKYDNEQSEKLGFGSNFNTEKEINDRYNPTFSMRDYVRIILGRMDDQAGMLITQALYDSSGTIVGNNTNRNALDAGSFCEAKDVTDVSEIVYNISGGVTNGASNRESLKERREIAKDDSPFKSKKIRYYVLLPDGFELKTKLDPDKDVPLHDSTEKVPYLSRLAGFYANTKGTTASECVVPTSYSNIPAWKKVSGNNFLSEMHWSVYDGEEEVTVNDKLSKGQLVVFERTLQDEINMGPDNVDYGDVFNLHGDTKTYFWGRGLSFSIVPIEGTGSIRAGTYTLQAWCQYLDETDKPMSLKTFEKNIDGNDVKDNVLKKNGAENVDKDTLLYIPSTFRNKSPQGTTEAKISLESNIKDENNEPIIQFGKPYKYVLDFDITKRTADNVVLWTNIEQQYENKPWYQGAITGIDLSGLYADGIQKNVEVYVSDNYYKADTYTSSGASYEWLNEGRGWKKIDPSTYNEWSKVKAFAFYFKDVRFDVNRIDSAVVRINMMAPDWDEFRNAQQVKSYPGASSDDEQKITYYADSPLIFSSSHEGDQGLINACTKANDVVVHVSVYTYQISITKELGAEENMNLNERDRNADFEFTLKLENLFIPSSELSYNISGGTLTKPLTGKLPDKGKTDGNGVTGNEDGTWNFKLKGGQTFALDGIPEDTVYTYTITEHLAGAFENGTPTVTGTVTSSSLEPEKVEFTNIKKKPEAASVNLNLTKKLTGTEWGDKTFNFYVNPDPANPDSDPLKNRQKVTVTEENASLFGDEYKFTAPGTYKYYVTEKESNLPGISSDGTVYTVTVVVSEVYDDNNIYQGRLKADVTVSGVNGYTLPYENTYSPVEINVPLRARKFFDGGVLEKGKFSFALEGKTDKDGKNPPMPTADDSILVKTNDEYGIVNFGKVTFTEPGEYKYTIQEIDDRKAGITYDKTSYTVTINIVHDEAAGVLKLESIAYDPTVLEGDIPVFTNTQETDNLLRVEKHVTGSGDKTRNWHFSIDFVPPEGSAADWENTVQLTFSDGTLESHGVEWDGNDIKFTLKDGEFVDINGLPTGTEYTVTETEANKDGYTTSSTGEKGTITKGSTATAEFVNHKPDEPDNPPDNPPGNPPDNPHKTEVTPGDGKKVNVGDKVTYNITWQNREDETATVVIRDPLDKGVDFVSADNGGVYDKASHTVTWTFEAESDAEGVVSLTVKVNKDAQQAGIIKNQAFVKVGDNPEIATEIPENPLDEPDNTTDVTHNTPEVLDNTPDNSPSVPNDQSDGPQTGDNSHLAFWLVLMSISIVCLIVSGTSLLRRRRKVKYRGRHKRHH